MGLWNWCYIFSFFFVLRDLGSCGEEKGGGVVMGMVMEDGLEIWEERKILCVCSRLGAAEIQAVQFRQDSIS